MKLNFITIMVRDLEKSLEFYCGLLSLTRLRELNPPQGRIVFLADQRGDPMLELIQFAHSEKLSANGMVFSFLADKPLAQLKEQAEAMGTALRKSSPNLPRQPISSSPTRMD